MCVPETVEKIIIKKLNRLNQKPSRSSNGWAVVSSASFLLVTLPWPRRVCCGRVCVAFINARVQTRATPHTARMHHPVFRWRAHTTRTAGFRRHGRPRPLLLLRNWHQVRPYCPGHDNISPLPPLHSENTHGRADRCHHLCARCRTKEWRLTFPPHAPAVRFPLVCPVCPCVSLGFSSQNSAVSQSSRRSGMMRCHASATPQASIHS